ncbi:TlpA family protein disulfide reductase [Pontibacter cellulosilyticus]|uniref:TlpA family protein disulfide reductase n=1 Tax=Pontibacter cellulosilyticus TaxID=1720253 RepID=A0A923N8X6_9BACT|nr:TlpA disulfide reductase family protein [Pontibacter cellulosilyticus]MBC5993957.1 TlpA family protein disulfide reductase [Pontibacter cellulosilyticus]
MKKVVLMLVLLFAASAGFGQHKFYYTLVVAPHQTQKANKLFIAYEIAGTKYIDSLTLDKKQLTLNKKLTQPVAAILYTDNKAISPAAVFLANNTLQVYVDAAAVRTDQTPLQNDFLLLTENDRVRPKYFPLYGELTAKNDTTGLNKLAILFDSLKTDDVKKASDYFSKHKDSFLSLLAFTRLTSSLTDPSAVEQYYKQLPDWAKDSPEGKSILSRIKGAKATQLGSKAIGFTQRLATGGSINLERFKGKYVLLDFWASWCGPCRKEHPNIARAYEELKEKGFEVVSVSLDTNEKAWLGAIEKDSMTWTNVSNLKGFEDEVAIKYSIQVLPANFLINPDGVIIAKDLKGEELVMLLESIIEE